MNSFEDLELSEPLARAIKELGFEKPTEIQAQALPILLGEPTDFIGLAATGTGKTAAYTIPMLEKIDSTKKRVQALVMCPTRELALQVAGQINLLGKFKGIRALTIYGGSGYNDQINGLRAGNQIVVGTPGRIIDHLEKGTLQLGELRSLVLDEADEMISMGFIDDIETILKAAPRDKNKIWLFSATMSPEVRKVAGKYLQDPQQVQVNKKEMLSTSIEQVYYSMRESDKPEILCKLIDAAEEFYGIIFCQTKSLVMDLTQYLSSRGYKIDSLHGDKTQTDRERTMRAFRERKVSILVCTDVASRGLDVKDITHVVNYSLPREMDVYVHRIGRTARVGKTGIAINLITPSHRGLMGRIEHMTKTRMVEGKIPTRRDVGAKKIANVLPKFQNQANFARAVELLSPEWQTAIAALTPDEIIGRFMTMLFPEIFELEYRDKKTTQPPAMVDSRGGEREGRGGRRDDRRDDRRGDDRRPRYGRDDRGPRRDSGEQREYRGPRRDSSERQASEPREERSESRGEPRGEYRGPRRDSGERKPRPAPRGPSRDQRSSRESTPRW